MSSIAIEAVGLSKSYTLGERAGLLGLPRWLRRAPVQTPVARSGRGKGNAPFWALRDLNIAVARGDVVGIIGQNGSGKSTLLKILARITEPTEGHARVRGRVGSLLEVGTGFHSELTGRENIHLSGALLGMKRREIERKFDEIVAFSEVEQFLDTPVKRYSSGMNLRLAFAVAAHLEPEILLVDEVLAVGDAAFQRKCIGKMSEVAAAGRTILVVSHSMAVIENLCDRVLLLRAGQVADDGEPADVIAHYMRMSVSSSGERVDLTGRADREGSGDVRFTGFAIEDAEGQPIVAGRSGQDMVFAFDYAVPPDRSVPPTVDVGVVVTTAEGFRLFNVSAGLVDRPFNDIPRRGTFRCTVPRLPLSTGRYHVLAALWTARGLADQFPGGVATFDVERGDFHGSGIALSVAAASPVLVDGSWRVDAAREPIHE